MNKLKFYFLAIIFGTVLIINGCDDDDNPVDPGPGNLGTFTLNGGGFINQTANIVEANAVYDSSDDNTTVLLRGRVNNDTTRLNLIFPGNETGNFPWGATSVQFHQSATTIYFSLDGEGTTNVTSYGNVGSNIEGNFSGTLGLGVTGSDTINVSGTFKARRIADQNIIQ